MAALSADNIAVTPPPNGQADDDRETLAVPVAPHYVDDAVTLFHGHCLDVMRGLPDSSVDSVVTDPPYELTANKKGGSGAASVNLNSPAGRARISTGFMGKSWDGTGIAFRPAVWEECLRVLKPGGYVLAFGGTRTFHRLACAIEDAGFEIRDSIGYGHAERPGLMAWAYGTGFPKSLNVTKALNDAGVENAPEGLGTALKPAWEPIIFARKPLVGTVAHNVITYGTGALNIDGCRLPGKGGSARVGEESQNRRYTQSGGTNFAATPGPRGGSPAGRWPANVVLDENQAAELDRQSGDRPGMSTQRVSVDAARGGSFLGRWSDDLRAGTIREGYNDSGGASRFFPTFKYQAKAPTKQRPKVDGISHPTVKPLDLLRWLVRLVTPPMVNTLVCLECDRDVFGMRGNDSTDSQRAVPLQSDTLQAPGVDIEVCDDIATQRAATVREGLPGHEEQLSFLLPDLFTENTCLSEMSVVAPPNTGLVVREGDPRSGRLEPEADIENYDAYGSGGAGPSFGSCTHCGGCLINEMRPGVVLDLFAGSGTTAEACAYENLRCVVIEREAEYLPLILDRLARKV